ncbi:hypothetical protein ACU4GA_28480 [Methylobacterium oryzae CBMB20]
MIGLADAGPRPPPTPSSSAHEFGCPPGRPVLAALLIAITDIHSLGLEVAQGSTSTASFYWDLNDGNPAFAERFEIADARQEADLVPGGRLRQHAALPEGGGGPALGQGQAPPWRRQDEGDTHRRPAVRQGHDPAGPGARSTRCTLFEAKAPAECRRASGTSTRCWRRSPPSRRSASMSEGGCPMVAGMTAK